MGESDQPTLPDYGGACIDQVVAAATRNGPFADPAGPPSWLPAPVVGAAQVVLLVLDGLGWAQLKDRPGLAPTMNAMAGGPITTVAPSTTAAALTSITIGAPPATHGVVGYRLRVDGATVVIGPPAMAFMVGASPGRSLSWAQPSPSRTSRTTCAAPTAGSGSQDGGPAPSA